MRMSETLSKEDARAVSASLWEKALWTFIQTFAVAIPVTGAVSGTAIQAATLSALAAAITLFINGISSSRVLSAPSSVLVDIGERTLRTFIASALPALGAVVMWDWDMTTLTTLSVFIGPALLSAIKGVASSRNGSAASLPSAMDVTLRFKDHGSTD